MCGRMQDKLIAAPIKQHLAYFIKIYWSAVLSLILIGYVFVYINDPEAGLQIGNRLSFGGTPLKSWICQFKDKWS